MAMVLSATPAFAGQRVALKDNLTVSGAEVRLGDLFDDAGPAAGVLVGRASGPLLVLDARQVQAIAAARGLEWANPNGYREIIVHTAPAAAQPPAQASEPAAAPAARTAAATSPEKMADALTWARSLAAGEAVRPEDVVWTRVPARLVPADAPRDPDAVVGQAARHALREGAAAAQHDLIPPKVVRRDQDVEVLFLQDGVRLVLTGRALADAALGEPVQVLNTQSHKTIEAIASGPGQAVVGAGADARRSNHLASLN
jgi:flagella basal body P-ring formation protein FlgA